MEGAGACWTPAKEHEAAGASGFETPAAASPASAFGFPASVLQPSRFRPRPLFPAPGAAGATPARRSAPGAPGGSSARTPRRARGASGVDLCAAGGRESPELACRDEVLATGSAAAPWSELYVLPHRRGAAADSASGWSGDSEPARASTPSSDASPASARRVRCSPVDLSPLARLLRGAAGAAASPCASPASRGRCALEAGDAAEAEAEAEARTPCKRKRRADGPPPERPARPRLCELLMRHHREAAMRVDPL